MNDLKDKVIEFLIQNKQDVLDDLHPLEEQLVLLLEIEDKVFHNDIKRQFSECIQESISDLIAKNLQLDPLSVLLVVEELDTGEFLRELKKHEDNQGTEVQSLDANKES